MDQQIIDKLPSFATHENGVIVINPDEAYPQYLAELGMEPDQYSVEVARRCMTLDLMELAGSGIYLKIIKGSGQFAIKNLPENPKYGSYSAAMGASHGPRIHKELKAKRGG